MANFIEWVDLENNGLVTECAILKRFDNGDIAYFPVAALDLFDRRRLVDILRSQSASLYTELWKLLEQNTLGNGVNALAYFNQLAKQRTSNGTILPFGSSKQSSYVKPTMQTKQEMQNVQQEIQPELPPAFDNMVKTNNKK